MNAQFSLPDFYLGQRLYNILFYYIHSSPEILYPNTEIHNIYGIFPGCIWNGSNISTAGSNDREEIKNIIQFYNQELNIPLAFTFTNLMVEPQHYYDTYGNTIAELGNNGMNSIIVSNLQFEEYLRTNYKNYTYCRSILAAENVPYALNNDYGEYNISIINRMKNNDWNYLNTIPLEDRDKIEFVCNNPCADNCPYIYDHYKEISLCQLQLNKKSPCKLNTEIFNNYQAETKSKTYISRKKIDEEYLPNGFNKFKCHGCGYIDNIIISILNYLIKPEYQDDILVQLL